MTLYAVTADGHNQPYGSEIYLIGVFDDKRKATETVSKCKYQTKITEVEMNKKYRMKHDKFWDEWSNEKYLGGYSE